MIDLRKTLNFAHSALNDNGIAHALIGGFAMAVYGQHRTTVDIDFLADGSKKDQIKNVLIKNGFKLTHESREVLQFEGVGFVDILLANRPMSLEMLKNANENIELGMYVIKPEDIIGLKIQAYINDPSRELQDKADIQNLLKLSGLNFSVIKKYADLFQEWPVIEKLKVQKS
ncbi:MAG: hypothetical protein ABL927_02125 [Bdellovibrionales bacterium]